MQSPYRRSCPSIRRRPKSKDVEQYIMTYFVMWHRPSRWGEVISFTRTRGPVDHEELQRRFGAAVRRRRLEACLGQEALADEAGVHRTHVSLIERGRGMPTLAVIHKLAS